MNCSSILVANEDERDYWIIKLDESGNLEWKKNYDGPGEDRALSILETNDGEYIVAGIGKSESSRDCWILKLDDLGDLIWEEYYGGSSTDFPSSIMQTRDGGYIFAGYTSSNDGDVSENFGGTDFWIVKLSATENVDPSYPLTGSFNCVTQ